MNHTIAECARWLEEHEEPGEVLKSPEKPTLEESG